MTIWCFDTHRLFKGRTIWRDTSLTTFCCILHTSLTILHSVVYYMPLDQGYRLLSQNVQCCATYCLFSGYAVWRNTYFYQHSLLHAEIYNRLSVRWGTLPGEVQNVIFLQWQFDSDFETLNPKTHNFVSTRLSCKAPSPEQRSIPSTAYHSRIAYYSRTAYFLLYPTLSAARR